MISETKDYVLPAIYGSALVNGDNSGLTEQEDIDLNKWHDDECKLHKKFYCVDVKDYETDRFTFQEMATFVFIINDQ